MALRIGQITDLHLRRAQPGSSAVLDRRSRTMAQLLPRAIEALRRSGVAFLAVTGDLIDAPEYVLHPSDYYDFGIEEWVAEAEADYREIKRILDAGGIPYMIAPGNHDIERALWRVFDEGENEAVLKEGFRAVRFCDREGEGHVPRRLDRERRLWERALGGDDGRPQIHIQHYVVTPDLSEGYPHTYLEHKDMKARTLASGRVALSLSGHFHPGTELIVEGPCAFASGPAFSDFPHPVRVYDIGPRGVSMETVPLLDKPLGAGRRAVFLDRDGVINTLASYSTGPEEMALIPGAAGAIRKLRDAGFAVVVVTGQSCVGQGYVTESTVCGVNDRMCRLLRREAGSEDAEPDMISFSRAAGTRAVHPRYADASDAKPSPAQFHRAAGLLGLTMRGSCMIGDSDYDLAAAENAGITPVLVRTGIGGETERTLVQRGRPPRLVFDDLAAAAAAVLSGLA